MKTEIYCLPISKGIHGFYLKADGETHYLFHQGFRQGVKDYFGRGVSLDYAMDFSRAKHDRAILRTMRKLPSYIKYIEKECGIAVFRKTKEKKSAPRSLTA